MKKLMLMAALMLSATMSYAQHAVGTTTIQPKIGLNVATITQDDNADPRIGLVAGAEFEHQIAPRFSLSAGVLYSMQGAKYDDATLKMDYINVPILANYYITRGLAIKAGLQPGFNINHKLSGNGVSIDIDHTGFDAKTVDLSIPVGLSYEIDNFMIDARYNFGVTEIIEDADSKNSVFQISVGYKFAL